MCNKKECKTVKKQIEQLNSLSEVERQLSKCQKCAYRKVVPDYKDETYLQVRIKYVELYQKNLRML